MHSKIDYLLSVFEIFKTEINDKSKDFSLRYMIYLCELIIEELEDLEK